ncbi:MAG TPA: thiamine diphosphokinase [Acidimicrobiia bacterium]|jgi:thiamine pyrophosphokinase
MSTILIFAGGDLPESDLADELPSADLILAADSGYDLAVHLGFGVDVLIGDLDSITTSPIPDHVVVERYPVDKDQTDLDLALELALREDPERVVVIGGTGGRFDHEISTVGLLCSDRWSAIDELEWVSSRGRAYVVRRRRIIHGDIGATVSLVPVGGVVAGVKTSGLQWELAGEDLPPGSTMGVSNVMRAPVTDIQVESGCLLVVFPG